MKALETFGEFLLEKETNSQLKLATKYKLETEIEKVTEYINQLPTSDLDEEAQIEKRQQYQETLRKLNDNLRDFNKRIKEETNIKNKKLQDRSNETKKQVDTAASQSGQGAALANTPPVKSPSGM